MSVEGWIYQQFHCRDPFIDLVSYRPNFFQATSIIVRGEIRFATLADLIKKQQQVIKNRNEGIIRIR